MERKNMNLYCDSILQNLYIGSKEALDIHVDECPFHFVVNCTVDVPFPVYPIENKLRIPVQDEEGDNVKMLEMMFYTKALEKIYACLCNKQPTLIYSSHGKQRACALVACFLIKYMRMTPLLAVEYIGRNRKVAFEEENHFIDTIDYYYCYLHYTLDVEKETINQKIDNKKRDSPRIQPI